MTFQFVHAADIHLDSPLVGLERHEGAPAERLRGATRAAFENLVSLCLERDVAFLVIAGDLYDGDWKDFNTGLFFVRMCSRLREAGIPVYLVRGNHDAASQITKSLSPPDNVHVFADDGPETVTLDHLGVAIHGWSYRHRAVTDDLAAQYPDAVAGAFNLGVLHTCATGRAGHANYAPTNLETLQNRRYDYWALGHVHAREVLSRDPWILFSGNLQGRNLRETGAKGCTLVTVADGAVTGEPVHESVDVLRWARAEVDVSECATADEVLGATRLELADAVRDADGRALALRLELVGASEAHAELQREPERWRNELLAAALDEGRGDLWVESIRLNTRTPLDLDRLRTHDDALGSFLRGLAELRATAPQKGATQEDAANPDAGDLRERLAPYLEPLLAKLPAALREGEDSLELDDPSRLAALLQEVEQHVVPRILAREEQ